MGKLFEPKTESINNDIAVRARNYTIINPWIGLRHLHDENQTVFASDNTKVAWSYWDVNEPNNKNDGEDCAHLYTPPKYDRTFLLKDCKYVLYVNDGYCDDESNTKECAWDGSDCCGDNVDTKYCSSCECLDSYNYKQITNGECNDETNTEELAWDGGDCCGDDVNTIDKDGNPSCLSCKCLEPSRWNDNSCDCEQFRRFICEKDSTG